MVEGWQVSNVLKPGRIVIHSPLGMDAARAELATAVREGTYWDPRSRPSPFYRLKGNEYGPAVSLRAYAYVLPGVRSGGPSSLTLVGQLSEGAEGSELVLDVIASDPSFGTMPGVGPILTRRAQRSLVEQTETLRLFLESILAV